MEISFEVDGKAQPAGSKRAFPRVGKNGKLKVSVVDDNPEAAPWKQAVRYKAREAYRGALIDDPVHLSVWFERARPRSHFLSSGGLSKAGRETPFPVTKPDATKLLRAIEDALTGVLYRDDAQIVTQYASKRWGERDRAVVIVRT